MANFPDLKQIAGKHNEIYEAYYRGVDPKNTNNIPAQEAAKFLKKSGLSDVVLSRIWDLSDPNGRGFLDKTALFVALKLISLAQAGEKIDTKNLLMETNAPKCGDVKMKPPPVPKMSPIPPAAKPNSTDWSIKPDEKQKYETLFSTFQPENGVLPGNKVKGLLMNSKLPIDTLSTIWELADQDKDGSLDQHEFIVAMHLVYKALENHAIPSSLPKELQKQPEDKAPDNFGGDFIANFPADIVPVAPVIPSRPPAPVAVAPLIPAAPLISAIPVSTSGAKGEWVLTTIEKLRYQEIFENSDLDKDGLVSGNEIKDVFLKSGLQHNLLAHIWALCDTHQSGKLNSEQFALAMWLIERKKKGIDPPQELAPEMVPPSMRSNASVLQPPKPIFTNPELEMISKEIEELTKERQAMEAVLAQKEADIRIKTGEMRSLQSELDTLTATLKQLETQKGEAEKRLNDLKAQVNKLREQCQKQEETIKEQETDLDSRRMELQKLKDEEHALEQEYDKNLKEKEKISVNLQDTQLQISQVRAMVTQLEEIQRQMKDALALCKVAIEENNPVVVSDYSLGIEPEFRDFKKALLSPEEVKDAFASEEPFNDNFKPSTGSAGGGFEDSFDNKASSGFADDDFGSKWNDPFGEKSPANNDPFASSNSDVVTKDAGKDEFGSDPFAVLHAPPKGSNPLPVSEPSPALPPKEKAKKPPPRPAPPSRPPPPSNVKPSSEGFGFANFDDFDIKASAVVSVSNNENISKKDPASSVTSDFQEDPFKNYRYEDPFLIEDPFAKDENGNEKDAKFDDFFEKKSTFDVVPESKSGKTFTEFDAFTFETDFANFDAFNNNTNNTANGAFNDPWKKEKKTSANVKRFMESEIKSTRINKFSEDYSDNFEMDLDQVLKRSMVEK